MKKLLDNMQLMPKILSMLLLLGAVTVGIAVTSYAGMTSLDDDYSLEVEHNLPATTSMVRVTRYAAEMLATGHRVATRAANSNDVQGARRAVDETHGQAVEALDDAVELDPTLTRPAYKLKAQIDSIHEQVSRAASFAAAGQSADHARRMRDADREYAAFGEDMLRLNKDRVKQAAEHSAELTKSANTTAIWSLLMAIVAAVAGVGTAVFVVRTAVTRPIVALQERMRRLAEGDSASEIVGTERKDEIGAMARALGVFRDSAVKQDKMIRAVTESAETIRRGSTEIAQASEDLAKRTESNAASLEETSAAMTEMSQRLKGTAESSGRTVARADQALSTVTGGRGVADEAVQAMGRVSESAKGIDSVIEGLDKIAFQTRVLAMNAAVEAGRAGEAGRGFAVVADLVSALAMRAEEEAKRARGQLTVTQTDIGSAVEAVQRVDGALENISTDVTEVHQLLASIASDNQAQASAVTQINAAVANMDQATQQNAAMVEETSAASRSLLNEVQSLTARMIELGDRHSSEQAPRHLWPDSPRAAPSASVHALPSASVSTRPEPVTNPVHQLQRKAVAAGGSRAQDDWAEF